MKEIPSHDPFSMNYLVQVFGAFALLSLNAFVWASAAAEGNLTSASNGNETVQEVIADGRLIKVHVIPIHY